MDKDTRKKILIGAFAFLTAGLFFAGIFFIGKKENLFGSTFTISAVFNDINGVKKGNYVYYSGLRAGIVQNIQFINDSVIVVDLKMDKKMQHLIKKDSKIYIATEGLVGNKIIEIKPVRESKIAVNDHDTIIAVNPFNTHELFEKLLSTNENATIITDNLAKLSERLNKPHKGLISTLSNDSTVVTDFKEIIQSFKNTGEQMSSLSSRLERIAENIDSDKGALGALISDTSIKRDITNTIENLNKVSNYSLKVVESLNNSVQSKNTKNVIGVLMKDSVFAKNLQEGMENFKNSTYKLDQNMEALRSNIFFRKYFRKNKEVLTKKPVL